MNVKVIVNKSSEDRSKADAYNTPPDVAEALLNYLNIPAGQTIWEPACGSGNLSEVFRGRGYQVISSDLSDTGYGQPGINFLTAPLLECDWIITNPPFKVSEAFIRTCIVHKKPFAMLLKSQYWHSKERRKLFEEFPPAAVLPLTWRPDFLYKKKGAAPVMECIWTVWNSTPSRVTIYQPLMRPEKENELWKF